MNDFIKNLLDTLKSSSDFFTDIGDPAIQAITDSAMLDRIPIISFICELYKIQDLYHLKKLKRNVNSFLIIIDKGNKEKIQRTLTNINEDETYREEFIDTILKILIESEKPIKAKILGDLLVSLSEDKLTLDEYNDLTLIIISTSIPAIEALKKFMSENISGSSHHMDKSLESLILSAGVGSRYGTQFRVSELGMKLYKNSLKYS